MKKQRSPIVEAQCCQEFIEKSWQEQRRQKNPADFRLPGDEYR